VAWNNISARSMGPVMDGWHSRYTAQGAAHASDISKRCSRGRECRQRSACHQIGLSSDRSKTADQRDDGDRDDAHEGGEITKRISFESSWVDSSREQSSDAVCDEREQRHSCLGAGGRRAGQPASTAKNASQAARKRAPRGATSKGTGPLVVTQNQTARLANAMAKTARTARAAVEARVVRGWSVHCVRLPTAAARQATSEVMLRPLARMSSGQPGSIKCSATGAAARLRCLQPT
jgi:hypothetical protein